MKLIRLACAGGLILVSGGCAERITAPSSGPEPQTIVVRGAANNSLGRIPLVVVDGRILADNAEMTRIDPNAIQDVEVLKGPVAVERFGARGANGVIVITMKRAG
jgi:TonB-dependent SusC/RagA subfamily outer membrane receptor